MWTHSVPFEIFLANLDPFGHILTYLDPFGQILCHLEQFGALWTSLDLIGPRCCVIFLSQEVASLFCPKRLVISFCSERLHDFLFCLKRLLDFFPSWNNALFFLVPRGCVIFFCPERLHDFLLSQEVACYLCPKKLRDFFLSQEVVWLFGPKKLRDFFVQTGGMNFFVLRGCVIFFGPERQGYHSEPNSIRCTL